MEKKDRLRHRLMAASLSLCAILPARSQVAFLGEGSIQASVNPAGIGSVASKGEFVPSSPAPLGLAATASAVGDNFNSRGTVDGTYGVIATFGGITSIAAANADYPAAAPNQAYYDLGGVLALSNTRSITSITVSDLIFDGPSSTVTTRLNFLFSCAGNYALSFNPVGKGNSVWGVTLDVQMPSVSGSVYSQGRVGDGINGRRGVPGVGPASIKRTEKKEVLVSCF